MKQIFVHLSVCSSFSLHGKMTPDRRRGRRAMIPRGLLGDEMEGGEVDGSRERERSDRLSVSEDDGDVPRSGQRYFFGPKLVFSRDAEG